MAKHLKTVSDVLAELERPIDDEHSDTNGDTDQHSEFGDLKLYEDLLPVPPAVSYEPVEVLGEGVSNVNATGKYFFGDSDQVEDPASETENQDDHSDDQDPDWEPTETDKSLDDDSTEGQDPSGETEKRDVDEIQGQNPPNAEALVADEPPQKDGRSRKRKRNPSNWKANIRKRRCQEGKPYLSVRNKMVPERNIKTLKNCHTDCKFKCMENISEDDRRQIHDSYYRLEQNRKYDFIANTTKCGKTQRPGNKGPSRRKNSFSYFFTVSEKTIRVCKPYYLGTLCISQKVIYNVQNKKDKVTGTPQSDKRGKHTKKVIGEAAVQFVKTHILSFPSVESHYCRAQTGRRYLESHLNVTKMHELYVDRCNAEAMSPVKLSFYRNVFNSLTPALDFYKPKSDRCDKCEEYETAKKNNSLTDALRDTYQAHFAEKEAMREKRRTDRNDKDKLVVSFDLQNVITCPKAEISSFFYKRKLNMYNLTGFDSLSKNGYCAVWCETVSGRSANDIASALIQILERVVLKHDGQVKQITTWSDSCVPQNRNSVIAFAVAEFLSRHQNIETVTMNYGTPGHSPVQEIDNIHSVLERAMSTAEFYSPVSAIRILMKANRKQPYNVIQMRGPHFKDYQTCAKSLSYKLVPFSKVTSLKMSSASPLEIQYKTTHQAETFQVTSVQPARRGRHDREIRFENLQPKSQDASHFHKVPQSKVADLKDMLKFMPLHDKEYYKATFNIESS